MKHKVRVTKSDRYRQENLSGTTGEVLRRP